MLFDKEQKPWKIMFFYKKLIFRVCVRIREHAREKILDENFSSFFFFFKKRKKTTHLRGPKIVEKYKK